MKKIIPILLSVSLMFSSLMPMETVTAGNIQSDTETGIMEEVSSGMEDNQ